MLSRLHVRNYVLIDSLEIGFPEGLIIITGQTGAGKSILLGALSLLMGAKADPAVIAEGADSCVVEAEFECSAKDLLLRQIIEDNDLEWDEGHLIIRRVVSRTGRSRAFVNDAPVSAHVLSVLSGRLLDIHSQHQTLLLSDRNFQLGILDLFAGNAAQLEKASAVFKELSALKSSLREVEEKIAAATAEQEYNQAQYRQLEAASLTEGELEELEQEQKQLANAEEIKECLGQVQNLFNGGGAEEVLSVDALLKESDRLLSRISRFVPETEALSQRVDSCRLELDDILSDVASIDSGIELSQARLEEVEDRMSLLYSLMQKHACSSVSELIALRDRLSGLLLDSTVLQERKDDLQRQIAAKSGEMEKLAASLHESRVKAVPDFARSITASVHSLELADAIFEVEVAPAALSATGTDAVTFLFSSTGRNAVELSKCASGGEMSRIMLTLKALMARYMDMPTMIFDEIDTGVSGSVADKMGSMICEMGQFMQVFAITHLPQVAAKGRAHYLVSKSNVSGKVVSTIERLSDEERVLELARMLSGSELSEAAVANARELLG